jgi:hypothetical protein
MIPFSRRALRSRSRSRSNAACIPDDIGVDTGRPIAGLLGGVVDDEDEVAVDDAKLDSLAGTNGADVGTNVDFFSFLSLVVVGDDVLLEEDDDDEEEEGALLDDGGGDDVDVGVDASSFGR